MSATTQPNTPRSEPPARRSDARSPESGITMIEVIIVLGVVSILALIVMPRVMCLIEKSKMSKMVSELAHAREAVEAYEIELGAWPPSLDDAFGGRPTPKDLIYCSATGDSNAGHGNEWCSFFDAGNPSGQNEHGGMPGVGYILATPSALAARCQNVNFFYTTCCGGDPIEVSCDDEVDIGHPGHGPFNDATCPGA